MRNLFGNGNNDLTVLSKTTRIFMQASPTDTYCTVSIGILWNYIHLWYIALILLTHHDKTRELLFTFCSPRASISITILTPYRLAVKYLFFFSIFFFATRYNLDRSISSRRNEWVIFILTLFHEEGQRTRVFELFQFDAIYIMFYFFFKEKEKKWKDKHSSIQTLGEKFKR